MNEQAVDTSAAIGWLADLVAMPSVSGSPLVKHMLFIASRLEATGAKVEILDPTADGFANLIAHFGPGRQGGIVWAGHLDVVPANPENWQSEPFRLTQQEDRLVGRGAVDMKGFLACALAMSDRFAAASSNIPQSIVLTFEEETSMAGARLLPDQLRKCGIEPEVIILGEPTDMAPCLMHPGVLDVDSHFRGIAGHGANREGTASAIEAACRFVYDLGNSIPAPAQFNIGHISGGTARNVVADECNLTWECRHGPEVDPRRVIAALEPMAPATRADQIVTEIPSFAGDRVAHDIARQISRITGRDTVNLPFATEAGIYGQAGQSTVLCGPGDWRQAHQANEYIRIDELAGCLDLMSAVCNGALRNSTASTSDVKDDRP